jgi:FlgD Ig-like domain
VKNVMILFGLLVLLCSGAGDASARVESTPVDQVDPPSTEPLFPRESMLNPLAVIWFGGDDGNGVALEGGIWTWDNIPPEDDPLEGWTSVDLTANPGDYYEWVDAAVFAAHGDPVSPMFPGSNGQLWCGIHQDEADERDFATGMGYQNNMCQWSFSPEMSIEPATDTVEIEFLYCSDIEPDYDFTRVYVLCYDTNDLEIGQHEVIAFTGLVGSPAMPLSYSDSVPAGTLDLNTATIKLAFNTTSDGGWSDEDGDFDSVNGPFLVDDISLIVGEINANYDFENGPQGWTFSRCLGVGTYMGVVGEAEYLVWMADASPAGDCDGFSGNALELNDEDGSPYWPPGHPVYHAENVISGKVARGNHIPEPGRPTLISYDLYVNAPQYHGSMFTVGFKYFPHTTPENPLPRWSPFIYPYGYGSFSPICYEATAEALDGVPAEWDSLQVFFGNLTSCAAFGIPPSLCTEEGNTYGTPLFDNVRVGIWVNDPSAVEDREALGSTAFLKVSPNPSSRNVTLTFRLPADVEARLEIYDATGRQVRRLRAGDSAAEVRSVEWDGANENGVPVSVGTYFCRLLVGDQTLSQKMIILE